MTDKNYIVVLNEPDAKVLLSLVGSFTGGGPRYATDKVHEQLTKQGLACHYMDGEHGKQMTEIIFIPDGYWWLEWKNQPNCPRVGDITCRFCGVVSRPPVEYCSGCGSGLRWY